MLGKLGSKLVFFEKHFISYACILFIKFNALRSFYTKLLCFFKNLFFPEFWSIKLIFRSIEIAIKNFGQPLFASIDAQLILDHQSKHFRSIKPNFRSIENCIKSFFKTLDSHVFKHFFKKFSNSFSLCPISQDSNQDFLSFSSVLFARFFFAKAGKTFLPFLLHLFTYFMH